MSPRTSIGPSHADGIGRGAINNTVVQLWALQCQRVHCIVSESGFAPMSKPILSVEGLSKCYLLGHLSASQERYTALRDVLVRQAVNVARKGMDLIRGRQIVEGDRFEEFWALRDVSFDVQAGDVVGVIGRNGAGKSTLLKVLSRITDPSKGRVTLRGRVASLLEVGTGFHPELSGRENIFLNGAILGMTRSEVRRKFDEIVDFAEIERFLDTPVKRYSSGMYVRLAFAVAAHLEPEILVVDEVLAVGDAAFQKKCLGKMDEVSKGGRTVLFVSHNMGVVQQLCKSAIYLEQGKVRSIGPVSETLKLYMSEGYTGTQFVRTGPKRAVGIVDAEVNVVNTDDSPSLELRITVESDAAIEQCSLDVRFADHLGVPVAFASLGALEREALLDLPAGVSVTEMRVPLSNFANGSYSLSIDLTKPEVAYLDRVEGCLRFEFESTSGENRWRNLNQQWGYGSVRIDPCLIALTAMARTD